MLDIKTKGLEQAMALLKTLQHMGNAIKAVQLLGKDREDSNKNNAEIITFLIKQDRDFFSADESMISRIDKKMVEIMEEELTKQTLQRVKTGKSQKSVAQAVAAKAFLAGMEIAKEIMVERIESQTTVDGSAPAELSEQYANWKQAKFGFTTIGKATGQLLDNLAPGSRNIKLRK